MKRRDILKFAIGFVTGGVMLAASAQAAPLAPISSALKAAPAAVIAQPAVVSQDDVNRIKPEQVRWHHRGHWHHHWHRHWHRHHHWHHRHW
jgi:hypothetical protein